MSPSGTSTHGAIAVRVLAETDRDIRCIGILHEMATCSTDPHEQEEDTERDQCHRIHPHDERLVRTAEGTVEVIVDRPLRQSGTLVLVEGEGDGIDSRNFRWSTAPRRFRFSELVLCNQMCDNGFEF